MNMTDLRIKIVQYMHGNSRYFGYAWIYRGYNTATQKDFHFKNIPYGANWSRSWR